MKKLIIFTTFISILSFANEQTAGPVCATSTYGEAAAEEVNNEISKLDFHPTKISKPTVSVNPQKNKNQFRVTVCVSLSGQKEPTDTKVSIACGSSSYGEAASRDAREMIQNLPFKVEKISDPALDSTINQYGKTMVTVCSSVTGKQ